MIGITLDGFSFTLTTFFISSPLLLMHVGRSLNHKIARKFFSIHSAQVLLQNWVTVKLSQRFVEPESGAPPPPTCERQVWRACNPFHSLCVMHQNSWAASSACLHDAERESRWKCAALEQTFPSPFLLNWTRPARIFTPFNFLSMESRAPSICRLNSNCNWLLNADARNWKKSAACVCERARESMPLAATHAKSIGRPQLIIRKVGQVLIARLKWISNLAHRNLHLV
jgi:hypothetical protein